MDASNYKDITVSRGLNYHYYFSPAQDNKPTILLNHGFPNTSWDWRFQVSFFKEEGYGLIVPDMLGYGGTAKPLNVEAYKPKLYTQDLVDILDIEKVSNVIAIGHDWGGMVTMYLATMHPSRFIAFGLLAVGWMVPRTKLEFDAMLAQTKAIFGYELHGYIRYMSQPSTPKVIEEHLDSFFSLMYAKDAKHWATDFAPLGALEAWLLADKKTEVADFVTPEEIETHKKIFQENGFSAPLMWYLGFSTGIDVEDNKAIPAENLVTDKPIFFGATERDYICLPDLFIAPTQAYAPNSNTIKRYDSSHWILAEHKDELNNDLLAWIKTFTV